ncbi:MAG TPA: glycosyltransferase family 39 protein [Blastocatellia bacterium]|nr:glycosyltransferase family 39 protein [Blastocatellia bacterium]
MAESIRRKGIIAVLGIALVLGSVWLGQNISSSPDAGLTFLIALVPPVICIWIILRDKTDRAFLLRLFILAISLRWALALIINWKHLEMFFGADAQTFDEVGWAISDVWKGLISKNSRFMADYTNHTRPGWGMFYYVAAVYYVVGRDQLLIQLINCALGAASCITVYKIAQLLYPEVRVARSAAFFAAVSPSMILWSSQMMKDGPIVLSLSLCALYTLKLQSKVGLKDLILLLVSLFCLFSLRNYAFYIMFAAVALALLLAGKRFSPIRVIQGGVLVVVIGGALTYLGAGEVTKDTFNLKKIQAGRAWSAKVANSGFGGDVDITDPQAALSFLPIGLVYVLFAPFPWMMTNLRQLITLPELIAWWLLVPMVVKGFWYSVRHRLKESFAIIIFTVGLTLVYALYQSNVGTAYRHRAQLYVFFFIFISIGLDLRRKAKSKRRSQIAFGRPSFTPVESPGAPIGIARPTADPRMS